MNYLIGTDVLSENKVAVPPPDHRFRSTVATLCGLGGFFIGQAIGSPAAGAVIGTLGSIAAINYVD